MKPTISIGMQDFEFLRENKCFFVDKTDFIKEWWENKDAVTLITRPRRFGKTLNLSMLNCFFLESISCCWIFKNCIFFGRKGGNGATVLSFYY